ncbi:MAG: hypothetical protein IAE91_01650 [Ignavibacteriaceae bacterium]|nr:hypothetical protein [Ignavibacteriaceae bacterium]
MKITDKNIKLLNKFVLYLTGTGTFSEVEYSELMSFSVRLIMQISVRSNLKLTDENAEDIFSETIEQLIKAGEKNINILRIDSYYFNLLRNNALKGSESFLNRDHNKFYKWIKDIIKDLSVQNKIIFKGDFIYLTGTNDKPMLSELELKQLTSGYNFAGFKGFDRFEQRLKEEVAKFFLFVLSQSAGKISFIELFRIIANESGFVAGRLLPPILTDEGDEIPVYDFVPGDNSPEFEMLFTELKSEMKKLLLKYFTESRFTDLKYVYLNQIEGIGLEKIAEFSDHKRSAISDKIRKFLSYCENNLQKLVDDFGYEIDENGFKERVSDIMYELITDIYNQTIRGK